MNRKRDFFLPYMLQLREDHVTSRNQAKFLNECSSEPFAFSYFNKLVYSYACRDYTTNERSCIAQLLKNCRLDTSSVAQEILCCIILSYAANKRTSYRYSNHSIFKYKEVILEDVPFCYSITRPSIKSKNLTADPSPLESMTQACRIGFYIILIADVLLCILITVTNGIMILVGIKHSFFNTPGGYV